MILSFEGVDGSGKSTQINLLREKLHQQGEIVSVFREPGGTDLSETIRAILLNPEFDIDPVSELLLFSAARSQLIAEKVRPLEAKGHVIILDRYYDSTTAYQGFGRESVPLESINHINELASHRLVPDLTFYLRISIEEAATRTMNKQKDRMEQSGETFYRKVIEGFDYLAESEDRFKRIDATQKKEVVHTLIWQEVCEYSE